MGRSKRQKKKKKPKGSRSDHHIIPRSRGGQNTYHNVVEIDARLHEHYHTLFFNKTPDEILRWLTTYFWNEDKSFLLQVAKEYGYEEET